MPETISFGLPRMMWAYWPDVKIPVTAAPEYIPENHTLHLDIRIENVDGQHRLKIVESFQTFSSSSMIRHPTPLMHYRRTYRAKIRMWLKSTRFAATDLGDKVEARAFRKVKHLPIADQNLLQGYYGRRRSTGRNRLWKFGRPVLHQRRDILKFIAAIRNSVHNAVHLYTHGSCYGFAKLLRHQYPEAVIWYDRVEGHVYTRIGSAWYDIRGIHYKRGDKRPLDHREGHRPHRWKPHNG